MKCYMCLTDLGDDHYEFQMWHLPKDVDGSGRVKLCQDCGKLLVRVILCMRADAMEFLN